MMGIGGADVGGNKWRGCEAAGQRGSVGTLGEERPRRGYVRGVEIENLAALFMSPLAAHRQ